MEGTPRGSSAGMSLALILFEKASTNPKLQNDLYSQFSANQSQDQ